MLKTSSTESAEPSKGVVRVGGSGRNRAEPVGKHELDGGNNDNGGRSGDSNRNSSNALKLICLLAPLTLMLRTNSSIDSSTSAAQIGIDYGGVDDGAITSMLRTSASTGSSASAAQIVVEFDGFDAGGGAGGKSVEKLSKSRELSKKFKKSQRPESCKGHRFGRTFIEAPILHQRARASVWSSDSFSSSPGFLSIPRLERLSSKQS